MVMPWRWPQPIAGGFASHVRENLKRNSGFHGIYCNQETWEIQWRYMRCDEVVTTSHHNSWSQLI